MHYTLNNFIRHVGSEISYKKSIIFIMKTKTNNDFIKKMLQFGFVTSIEETTNQWKISLATDNMSRPIIKNVWVPKTSQPVFFTYKKLVTFLKTSLFPYRPFQTLKSSRFTNLYEENHTSPSIICFFATPNGVFSQHEMLKQQIGGVFIGLIYTLFFFLSTTTFITI